MQAIKAGILEIGDLFAVNKADRPGADRTANELRAMLELGEEEKRPLPVLLVSASQGTGVTELCEELERQYLLLDGNGELARRRALRLRSELLTLVREGIEQRLLRPPAGQPHVRSEPGAVPVQDRESLSLGGGICNTNQWRRSRL